jgi:hypothetical protein
VARIETDNDDPSLAAKVAGVGEAASGFLPGPLQWLNVPMAGVKGAITSGDEQQQYEKMWGSLGRMSHRNHGVKRGLERLKNRWKDNIGEAAVSTGGALIGMAIGTALIPIPIVGSLIGSIVGGYAVNKIYNKFFNKQHQDPLILAKQIHKMQRKGEEVSPELVFATLAANLPDKKGSKIDDLLEAETGTRLFNEALADPQNRNKIAKLMRNPRLDEYIRDTIFLPPDPLDPTKTTAEQLAELINSRQIQAKDLLCPSSGIIPTSPMVESPYQTASSMPIQQPSLPLNNRGTPRGI